MKSNHKVFGILFSYEKVFKVWSIYHFIEYHIEEMNWSFKRYAWSNKQVFTLTKLSVISLSK